MTDKTIAFDIVDNDFCAAASSCDANDIDLHHPIHLLVNACGNMSSDRQCMGSGMEHWVSGGLEKHQQGQRQIRRQRWRRPLMHLVDDALPRAYAPSVAPQGWRGASWRTNRIALSIVLFPVTTRTGGGRGGDATQMLDGGLILGRNSAEDATTLALE
jgi:hypothetical protein